MTLIQDQHDYYESLYHLVQVSVYKLNNPTEKEPSLKRQLLIRNLLILSSNLITTQPTEQVWFDACFDELDQEEDYDMEEEQDNLVVMFPFDYVTQEKDQPITLFLHVK
ncbi:hypothetical protein INT48_000525 [Thamnidium elegans]|uniref:Uncharacterized protein n=1 Tax=Thamnidium elegans TaxID=101142 RepID=A0A8H7VXC2_9FUNG|nr:hypothetical protein INT48_000525 [Thamnidium elegans]